MGRVRSAIGSMVPGRRRAQRLTRERDDARAALNQLIGERDNSQQALDDVQQRVLDGRAALFEYAYHPKARQISHDGKSFFDDLVAAGDADYTELLERLGQHVAPLANLSSDEVDPRLPYWDNPWLPPLDGIAIYALLAELKPATYLEVGSGFSTKYARRAIEDHGLNTVIVSIDPHPRAEIDDLCDEVIRKPYEEVEPAFFDRLQPGDVFFVDNSHRSFTGSDVTVFFTETLPYLPSGVIFGVHDIFIPHDYPDEWNDRFYSEQYLLMTYLLGGAMGDRILLPVNHLERHPDLSRLLGAAWPAAGGFPPEKLRGGAFWMTKA